jgi:hypothetical protein
MEGQGNQFFWLDGERKMPSGKHTADVLAAHALRNHGIQDEQSSFEGIWPHDDPLAPLDSLMKGRHRYLLVTPPFGSHDAVQTKLEQQPPWILLALRSEMFQRSWGSAGGSLDGVVPG